MSPDARYIGKDRRSKKRFDIERDVRYKLLFGNHMAETGAGRSLNISSSGIHFSTDTALMPGLPVELSLSWPALLNDSCPMKLMIFGCVVRSNATSAVVSIERYEFRTQGSLNFHAGLAQQPEIRLPN